MARQKSAIPLRHFSLSLAQPLYDQYNERSKQWALSGKRVTITDLLVRAAERYINQGPWWEDSF